jgi:hypothetical protein
MFAGFKSRRTIPRSCAASSASAICRTIGSASASQPQRAARDPLAQRLAVHQFQHQSVEAVRG